MTIVDDSTYKTILVIYFLHLLTNVVNWNFSQYFIFETRYTVSLKRMQIHKKFKRISILETIGIGIDHFQNY